MTTLVNRLEAAGQAERVADPTDGRAALVRITEAGRALLRRAPRRPRRTCSNANCSDLDDADRAALRRRRPRHRID